MLYLLTLTFCPFTPTFQPFLQLLCRCWLEGASYGEQCLLSAGVRGFAGQHPTATSSAFLGVFGNIF